jgi:hypothetical protein
MNSRAKGNRVQRKAIQYALTWPGVIVRPLYQPAWYATPQEFDLMIFRPTYWIRLVEVRANQWRTGKSNTVALTKLPGEMYHRQIWLFRDQAMTPLIRAWNGVDWISQEHPWENE